MDMLFSTTQVKRSLAPFLTLLLCLFLAFPLLGQKKVVLTDSKNDPYINNSEGYWNGKSKPGDKYEKGGDLEAIPVEIGLFNTKYIEIRSGLEEGDEVMLNPPLDRQINLTGETTEDSPPE